MSVGRLHGGKNNARVNKARIAAKLSGVTIDWDESFVMGTTNKTSEFLGKFPLGQVPAFESKDGLLLTESCAIAFYLASLKDNNPILGKNKAELAKIYQFAFFMETQYMPHFITILLPVFGKAPYDEAAEKAAYEKLDASLAYLDNEIKSKTYLVGDNLTLADVLVGENLAFAYSMVLIESHRNKFPNLTKYFNNYRAISEVKEIAGETKLCETALKPKA